MAIAKRLSYSLLISTLAFAVFSAVAFSGLFPWIEAQFYSPRVTAEIQGQLEKASGVVEAWKKESLEKLDKLLASGDFDGVFNPTASQESLQKRFQDAKLFVLGTHGGGSLRFLNADRTQFHFSTEETDVKVRSDFRITYHAVAEISDFPDLKAPALEDGSVHILLDSGGRSLYFLKPLKDSKGTLQGFILWNLALEDLRFALLEAALPFADQPVNALGPESFLFSSMRQKIEPAILTRVKDLSAKGILPPVQRLARADGQLTFALIQKGPLGLLVPVSTLEMGLALKVVLLVSFYTVLFLLVFLLANLRGEPVSLVTRKVKRFQLQVVKQYLDLKESDKIQSLRDELARHSDEIRSDVRRSLGRLRKRDEEWVDRYIDTSWQEVMDLLRGPAPPVESSTNADWKRLETMLQQALTQGRFVVSGAAPAAEGSRGGTEDLEELEEVAELDEAEEAEEVQDAEEVEEVEALEEVEDVPTDDAEELEVEAAPEEPEELEELEELDAEIAEPQIETSPAARKESVSTKESDDEELEELEELEVEDEQEEDSGGLEELLPTQNSADLFHPRKPSQGGPAVTELFEEVGGAEVEELEVLDELEEVLDELPEDGDGNDASYSLEKLDSVWGSASSGVFDETDDVVTLREELFEQPAQEQDEFGALVEDVMAGGDPEAFVPLEEDFVPRHTVREWRWTGGGFDWDRFALEPDEVSLFRALSEIVTELDAFTAAILTETEGRWSAKNNVGFSDIGKTLLDFGPDSPLFKSFLTIRALHVLNGGSTHPVLRQSFHTKDLKFLKTIVLVPLLFRREPAWLLLGMRNQPEDLLTLLAPRRLG